MTDDKEYMHISCVVLSACCSNVSVEIHVASKIAINNANLQKCQWRFAFFLLALIEADLPKAKAAVVFNTVN